MRQVVNVTSALGQQILFTAIPGRLQGPLMSCSGTTPPYASVNLGGNVPQYAAVNALYEKVRLISAGLRCRPTTNSTTDQGIIYAGISPGLDSAERAANNTWPYSSAATVAIGFNEVAQLTQTSVYPFKTGATVVWRPQDANSFVFTESFLRESQTPPSAVDNAVFSVQDIPFMYMGIGNVNNPTSYILEYICHYEGTVSAGNAGVIALQKPPIMPEHVVSGVVDKVFGSQNNKSSFGGTTGGYAENMVMKGGGGGDSFFKDLLDFGATVGTGLAWAIEELGPLLL